MRLVLGLVMSVLLALPAHAEPPNQQEREEIWKVVQDLAECGAVYEAMSRALKIVNGDVSAAFHNLGNGAVMAASVAGSYVTDTKRAISLAENIREGKQPGYSAMISNGGTEFKKALDKCQELNSLQEELVQEGRKALYGFAR